MRADEAWAALGRLAQTPAGRITLAINGLVGLCVAGVVFAVLHDFNMYHRRAPVIHARVSGVATATMSLFIVGLYALIALRIGACPALPRALRGALAAAGLLLLAAGAVVNVAGRLRLGANWADQVTIYREQRLVRAGMYAWVRHPLYASLIGMVFGAGLVYANLAVILANVVIFIPMMYYRARQEERCLLAEFPEYAAYRARVGMFWPRRPARSKP